jgi:hypothetical protein
MSPGASPRTSRARTRPASPVTVSKPRRVHAASSSPARASAGSSRGLLIPPGAEQARRATRCRGDRVLGALDLVAQHRRGEEPERAAMPVGVVLDAMAAPRDFRGDVAVRLDAPPDAEERRARPAGVEHVEDPRGDRRIGAVVERERDLAPRPGAGRKVDEGRPQKRAARPQTRSHHRHVVGDERPDHDRPGARGEGQCRGPARVEPRRDADERGGPPWTRARPGPLPVAHGRAVGARPAISASPGCRVACRSSAATTRFVL